MSEHPNVIRYSAAYYPHSSMYLVEELVLGTVLTKGMAYMELMTVLARTLHLYELRLTPGTTIGEGYTYLE